MSNIAICFDPENRQYQDIGTAIETTLLAAGYKAAIFDISNGQSPPIVFYDGIIVIGPIHAGHHSKHLRHFIKSHHVGLSCLPNAFFSVSLSAAGDEQQQADAARVRDAFLSEVNWSPDQKACIAGDLPYRKYGFFTRWLMKWIVRRAGEDTDTSCNFTYTDWEDLAEQTRAFADFVQQCQTTTRTISAMNETKAGR